MKKKTEKIVASTLLTGSYGYLFGLALWRAFGHPSSGTQTWHWLTKTMKQAESAVEKADAAAKSYAPEGKAETADKQEQAAQDDEHLESLSLKTPGNAPLDRLARQATFEKWQERLEKNAPAGESPKSFAPGVSVSSGRQESESGEFVQHEGNAQEEVLQHQALESGRLAGWNSPRPEKLPVPTFAPAVMALGIVIFAMGLATVWYVCTVGSIVFAVAAWRWVGELQGD